MPSARQGNGPRGPGFAYAAIAAALVAVLTALTLSFNQTPPPTVAEFAPQAVEQIKDAPAEQSSRFGSGSEAVGGEGRAPDVDAVATPRPRDVVDVPRVRRCVGNPPRQVEDPQSPPCVPYWRGDNGGQTTRGVTASEIRVFVPVDGRLRSTYDALTAFFNKRFEFYGRRLVLVYGRSDVGTASCTTQKAEATDAAERHQAFASTMYRASSGFCYHDEAARRGVVTVAGSLQTSDASYLRRRAPYLWHYLMDADEMFRHLSGWICRRLGDAPARFGGDDVRDRPRRYGVYLHTYYDDDRATTRALEAGFDRCGIDAYVAPPNSIGPKDGDSSNTGLNPVGATNVLLQMQDEGVTSIVCVCHMFVLGNLMRSATNQNFFPEWVLSSYGVNDVNAATALGSWPLEQVQHAFGLSFQPRQVRPDGEPYRWAAKEADPAYSDDGSSASVGGRTTLYRPFLVLASGIQMAGPRLTPETFAAGLQRTAFPNPRHPNQAGAVGFTDGDFAMTDDGTEFWWSPGGPSPYTGGDAATMCYVDGGRRYPFGTWLANDTGFFEPPCDAG